MGGKGQMGNYQHTNKMVYHVKFLSQCFNNEQKVGRKCSSNKHQKLIALRNGYCEAPSNKYVILTGKLSIYTTKYLVSMFRYPLIFQQGIYCFEAFPVKVCNQGSGYELDHIYFDHLLNLFYSPL